MAGRSCAGLPLLVDISSALLCMCGGFVNRRMAKKKRSGAVIRFGGVVKAPGPKMP